MFQDLCKSSLNWLKASSHGLELPICEELAYIYISFLAPYHCLRRIWQHHIMSRETCVAVELLSPRVVETDVCAKVAIDKVVPNPPKLALSISVAK